MAETWDNPDTTQELTGIEREVVAVFVDAFLSVIDETDDDVIEEELNNRLAAIAHTDDEDVQNEYIASVLRRLRPKLN